jgi:deoxyadenosine/deoxycytidine kinase
MIGHKLPNKTKSATVAEPKYFHHLNKPLGLFFSSLPAIPSLSVDTQGKRKNSREKEREKVSKNIRNLVIFSPSCPLQSENAGH